MLANSRLALCLVFALALGMPGVAQQSGDQATIEKLLAVLQTGNDGAKREAIEQLGNLGSKAKNAVPALLHVMSQHRGRPLSASAMVALGKIGPEADAALTALHQVAMARHPNAREEAEIACVAIGKIGAWTPETTRSILRSNLGHHAYFAANPEATLPQLLDLLQNDGKTPIDAMRAWRHLAELRDDDVLRKHPKIRAKVVDYAAMNLASANPELRWHAADLFRTLAPDQADKIIPVLVGLIKERAAFRRDVGQMLSGQGDHATVHDDLRSRALPALYESFADAAPEVQGDLVEIFAGHHYRYDIDWLPDALSHKHASVRAGAAAVARRSLSDKRIVQKLRGLLKDPDLAVRVYSAAALSVHDRSGAIDPLVPPLIDGWRQGNASMRLLAVQHLGSLGKDAAPATAALLEALSDSEFNVRHGAADALLNLDSGHAKRVLPMIQTELRNRKKTGSLHPVFDLTKRLGKDAQPVVPDLVAVMEANPMWIGRVAELLETLDTTADAKRAIPTLQKWLKAQGGPEIWRDVLSASPLGKVSRTLAKLGAPDHARATLLLAPNFSRGGRSFVLDHYFPAHPNETVDELTKLLDQPKLRLRILKALGQVGDGEHPAVGQIKKEVMDDLEKTLGRLLDEQDLTVRATVLTTMRKLRLSVPAKKMDTLIRECAASKSHQIVPMRDLIDGNEKLAAPLLIEEAVKQRDLYRFLGMYQARSIPILLQIAKEGAPEHCMHAAWGLAYIAPGEISDDSRALVIKTLLARLPELKMPAKGEVAMAILRLGAMAPPREAVVAVGEYLVDKNTTKPATVVGNLRYLAGKNGAPAIEHVHRALSHANPEVRANAAIYLAEIDRKYAGEILPAIRNTVGGAPNEGALEPDRHFEMALQTCVLLGAEARPLLPRLLEINRTRRDHFAILAGQAAVAIDKENIPGVANNFALVLSQSRFLIREHSLTVHQLLREWGKPAASADVHLASIMRQNRDYMRYEHAATLILLQGPNAAKGIEQMRRGLRNKSSDDDCREALKQFSALKSRGKDFLPELRLLLNSPHELYREQAARAIGAIGPDAKELLPELHRLLEGNPTDFLRLPLQDAIKAVSK